MNEIDERMNGIAVPGENRSRVFFGLLHLSLEHFGAIVVLSKQNLFASAAALLRPQYEATIRALYFHQCASESEITAFTSGKDPMSLKKMLDALEGKKISKEGTFANFYQNTKQFLHGFTHGGFEQLSRRYTESELINSFKNNEIESIVASAQVLACLSACCASTVSGNEALAIELIGKYGKYEKQP